MSLLESNMISHAAQVEELANERDALKSDMAAKDVTITECEAIIAEQKATIAEREVIIDVKEATILELGNEIARLQTELAEHNQQMAGEKKTTSFPFFSSGAPRNEGDYTRSSHQQGVS